DVYWKAGAKTLDGSQRRPRGCVEMVPRNWPRTAASASVDERAELVRMALVLVTGRATSTISRPHLDGVPPLYRGGAAATKHLNALGRAGAITSRLVGNARYRSVCVT